MQEDANLNGIGDACEGLDQGSGLASVVVTPQTYTRFVGDKRYELSNHLGNVLSVVSDRKLFQNTLSFTTFAPDVLSYSDYYPFGMLVPNRHKAGDDYRYGFNGKENDNEVMGEGNFQDYGMRMYNPRIGRFFNEDPLTKKYPELTPYQFASNTPIQAVDLDGLEGYKVVDHQSKTTTIVIDFYYSPKDLDTKSKDQRLDSEFTQSEVESIKKGIMKEFDKNKFEDKNNSYTDGENTNTFYSVKLQINLHKTSTTEEAKALVNSSANDPLNSNIYLFKNEVKVSSLKDKNGNTMTNSEGEEMIATTVGGSQPLMLGLFNKDSHTATHELFHNLIHNHQNASLFNKTLINPADQRLGHKLADGIFIYNDPTTNTVTKDLNQKNINDALDTVPEKTAN